MNSAFKKMFVYFFDILGNFLQKHRRNLFIYCVSEEKHIQTDLRNWYPIVFEQINSHIFTQVLVLIPRFVLTVTFIIFSCIVRLYFAVVLIFLPKSIIIIIVIYASNQSKNFTRTLYLFFVIIITFIK